MKKRILLLCHTDKLGPRLINEVRTLEESFDIFILYWDRTGSKKNKTENNSEGWVSLKAPLGTIKSLIYVPLLYIKIFKKVKKEEFSIIHTTHIFLLPIAIYLGKKKKAKVLYDAYERYSIDISSNYFKLMRGISRRLIEIIENYFVRKTNGVLTIDSPNDVLINRYKRIIDNAEILYNVPNLQDSLDINENSIHKLKKKYQNSDIIIYVGTLTKQKGILKAIEAFALVKKDRTQVKLILIGPFIRERTRNEVQELIMGLGLIEHIEIIAWIPYQEMMHYLKISKVGLALHQPHERFKYISKGTGRKFFTYMESGVPIVGPKFAKVGEIVEETGCGVLVDTNDKNAIANAIIDLLGNPNKIQEMGKKGRKAIEERYNWKLEESKLLNVYKKVNSNENKSITTIKTNIFIC